MCCCGHGKYAPTILYRNQKDGAVYDFLTPELMVIGNNNHFYKKDSEGYFYIPKLEEAIKRFQKE
jgi:hypothetical protein